MEVASPLTSLRPSPGGSSGVMLSNKRSCSPAQQLLCPMTDGVMVVDTDATPHNQHHDRLTKRRRFHAPTEIDSLSADFSSHTLFFNGSNSNASQQQQQQQQQQQPKSIFATNGGASTFLKRVRMAAAVTTTTTTATESTTTNSNNNNTPTPEQQHQQQEAQKKHEELERIIQEQASLIESLQGDKMNIEKSLQSIQSDHERILKDNSILRKAVTIQEERRLHLEQEVKVTKQQSDEKIKGLEQIILTLRYHLQASQSNVVTNDFMHQRPPDVY